MNITEADIEKIAQLAHLEITDSERKVFAPQISEIVTYFGQLNEADAGNVEVASEGSVKGEKAFSARADATEKSLGQEVALKEAPDSAHGYFRVPKVLQGR